ncbi:LOW QUALITY PROTEIN: hypothetical protein AAY473_028361 [Plecturocebus cupreus]
MSKPHLQMAGRGHVTPTPKRGPGVLFGGLATGGQCGRVHRAASEGFRERAAARGQALSRSEDLAPRRSLLQQPRFTGPSRSEPPRGLSRRSPGSCLSSGLRRAFRSRVGPGARVWKASGLEGSRGPGSRRARREGDPGRLAGAERQGGRRNLGCFPGGQGQPSRVIRALQSACWLSAERTPGRRRESPTAKLGRGSAWASQKPGSALDPGSYPGVLGSATPVAPAKAGLSLSLKCTEWPQSPSFFLPHIRRAESQRPLNNPRRWGLLSLPFQKGETEGGRAGKEEATAGRQSHRGRRGLGHLKILLPALVSFWGGGWGQPCGDGGPLLPWRVRLRTVSIAHVALFLGPICSSSSSSPMHSVPCHLSKVLLVI